MQYTPCCMPKKLCKSINAKAVHRTLVKSTLANWNFRLHFFSALLPFSLTQVQNVSYFKSSFNWISSHFLSRSLFPSFLHTSHGVENHHSTMNTSYTANKLLYENENNFWNDNNDYYSTPNPQTPRTHNRKRRRRLHLRLQLKIRKSTKWRSRRKKRSQVQFKKKQNLTTT